MILWTVILWRLEAGLGRSGNGNRWQQRQVDLVSCGGVGLALAVAGVGLIVSLSVSLVSPSRRLGDTAAALPLCLSSSRTLAQSLVALASRSLTFLSSFFFFFLFFPLVFAFSVWFWTAEGWDFFLFFFFLLWIDMGYGLMSSALGWPDDGLGEGGPEQKFQGGPSPYFFFWKNFTC